jgi:flavodoxin
MKALVVFYSLEGNTAHVAQAIADSVGADVLRLEPVSDVKPKGMMKYVWGGKQVLSKGIPELKPYEVDLGAYTHLFIGSPVWAGSYAPALRSFLAANRVEGKQIGLFCCYAGSEGKCIAKMRDALPGNTMAAERLAFRDPLKHAAEATAKRAAEWAAGLMA